MHLFGILRMCPVLHFDAIHYRRPRGDMGSWTGYTCSWTPAGVKLLEVSLGLFLLTALDTARPFGNWHPEDPPFTGIQHRTQLKTSHVSGRYRLKFDGLQGFTSPPSLHDNGSIPLCKGVLVSRNISRPFILHYSKSVQNGNKNCTK